MITVFDFLAIIFSSRTRGKRVRVSRLGRLTRGERQDATTRSSGFNCTGTSTPVKATKFETTLTAAPPDTSCEA